MTFSFSMLMLGGALIGGGLVLFVLGALVGRIGRDGFSTRFQAAQNGFTRALGPLRAEGDGPPPAMLGGSGSIG